MKRKLFLLLPPSQTFNISQRSSSSSCSLSSCLALALFCLAAFFFCCRFFLTPCPVFLKASPGEAFSTGREVILKLRRASTAAGSNCGLPSLPSSHCEASRRMNGERWAGNPVEHWSQARALVNDVSSETLWHVQNGVTKSTWVSPHSTCVDFLMHMVEWKVCNLRLERI